MYFKKMLILLFVIPILILSVPGCTSSDKNTSIGPKPQSLGEIRAPIELKLELSHAPKVGEPAEATLIVINNELPSDQLGKIRAWLEFSYVNTAGSYLESRQRIEKSPEDVLIGGDLNWQGTLTADKFLEFHTNIRFPDEGIWEITGYIEGNVGRIASDRVELVVEHDRAGIYGSEAYAAGELEWMKDYSDYGSAREYIPDIPDSGHPIVMKIDLSKAPRLNESTELSWTITSIKDTESTKVWAEFRLLETGSSQAKTPSSASLLENSNLPWEGSLKKGIPFASSAIVRFPEEGDWEITLRCIDDKSSFSTSDSILLNVTAEEGKWGWAQSYSEIYKENMPPQEDLPWAEEPALEERR